MPRDADRGQSIQIGAVLLFGILVISLAFYQAVIVPDQNRQIEGDHNQDVRSDLEDLRASLLDVSKSGEGVAVLNHRPVRVRLGTQYPTRAFAVNPPPPQGSIFTRSEGSISVGNATVTGDFAGDPQATLLGTDHETEFLVYDPDYNEYQNAPRTVFEHSLLYDRFDGSTVPVTDQRLVRGDSTNINIVRFEGDVSESAMQTTLEPVTLDGPTARVPIEASDGDTFEITFPSASPEVWTDANVIGESFDEGEKRARASVTGENEVTITLDDSGTDDWTLQMTSVGYEGGEPTEVFSNVREQTSDSNGSEQVYGPLVSLDDDELRVQSGEAIDLGDLGGQITSAGEDDRIRSGTPIREVRYVATGPQDDSGVAETFDPDDPGANRSLTLTDEGVTIDTSGWDPGEYSVEVRAQDAAGYSSEDDERGEFTANVTAEGDDPTRPPPEEMYAIHQESWSADDEYIFEIVADDVWEASWDFGDGSTGNGHYEEHEYAEPGTYPIELDVVYQGESYTYTDTVSVEQALQPVETEGVDTQSGRLQFTLENTGSQPVQIEQFAVDATTVGADVVLNDGNNDEFSTQGAQVDGSANARGNGNVFDADGTGYDLEDEGGTDGEVAPEDDSVAVTLDEFQNGWIGDSESLEFTDADSAEVTVTLVLADGREQPFHFRRR